MGQVLAVYIKEDLVQIFDAHAKEPGGSRIQEDLRWSLKLINW